MTRRGWIKLITLLAVAVLIIILIWRNTETARFDILFIPVDLPRCVLFAITFLLGFVAGLLTFAHFARRKN